MLTAMSSVSSLPPGDGRCNLPTQMNKKSKSGLAARLLKCREEKRWTQDYVGDELGVTSKAVSQWENNHSQPTPARLRRAAILFDKSYEWLSTGRGSEQGTSEPVEGLELIGDIAAGVWHEVSESQEMEYKRVSVAPVPDYPVNAQYALRIIGNSVDRIAKDGAIIHCVDVARAGIDIRDGDIVCVERRRPGLVEMTVKQVKLGKGKPELWPVSDDPAHQEKLPYRPPRGNGEVVIKAIVISVLNPVPRGS